MRSVILAVMMLSAIGAMADDNYIKTAQELRTSCRQAVPTVTDPYEAGTCVGFVGGFMDGFVNVGVYNEKTGIIEMLSPVVSKLTVGQTIEVFLKFVDQNPEDLAQPAVIVIGAALLHFELAKFMPIKPAKTTGAPHMDTKNWHATVTEN